MGDGVSKSGTHSCCIFFDVQYTLSQGEPNSNPAKAHRNNQEEPDDLVPLVSKLYALVVVVVVVVVWLQ